MYEIRDSEDVEDNFLWIVYKLRLIERWPIFYERKSGKYLGYVQRAAQQE